MELSSMFAIAIVFFLAVNLCIGIHQGRNVTTIQDYALANRSVGTGVLTITLIATFIGSKYLTSRITAAQGTGLSTAVFRVTGCMTISFLLGWFVYPKLLRFKNCYTMGGIMKEMYGKHAGIFTGILSTLCFMFVIVSQLVVLGNLCKPLQLSRSVVILGIGTIITLYTLQGVRAVKATDVLQFALVLAGFLFIAHRVISLEEAGNGSIQNFFHRLSSNKKYAKQLRIWRPGILGRLTIPLYDSLLILSPPIIQRVLMARSTVQVKKTFIGFALFYPMFYSLIIMIGFGLLLTHGTSKIPTPKALESIVKYIFNGSPWATILLGLMLLAVIMSTVDSFINALGIVVVQDIIKPIIKPKHSFNELQWVKYASFLLGIICTILGLYLQSAVTYYLFNFPTALFGALIIPFIAGILGLKGNTKTFFYTIVTFLLLEGILTTLAYNETFLWDMKKGAHMSKKIKRVCITIMLIISLLYPLIIYLIKGGLVIEKIKKPEVETRILMARRRNKEHFAYLFRHPLLWAQKKMIHYGSQPTTIGLLLSFTWMIPIVTSPSLAQPYQSFFLFLRAIGLIFCVFLMIHPVWNYPYKRYFPLFWWLALLYNLPFSYTTVWLFNPGNSMVLCQLILSALLLFLLVDWRSFTVLFSLGTIAAVLVNALTYGTENLSKIYTFEHMFHSIFGIFSAIVIGYFVGKRKEQVDTERIEQTKIWASAFGHDLGNIFWNILLRHPDSSCPLSVCHILENKFKKTEQKGAKGFFIEEDQYKLLSESAQIVKRDLQECMDQMDMFRKLISKGYVSPDLMVKTTISKIIKDSHKVIPYVFKEYVKILPQKKDFPIKVHPILMHNVITNLAKNARYHGGAEEIILTWDTDKRQLLVKDNGRGIPPHVEPYIFDLYYTTGGQGVGLPFVKMVLEQMGASINFTTSKKGTTFFVKFEEK